MRKLNIISSVIILSLLLSLSNCTTESRLNGKSAEITEIVKPVASEISTEKEVESLKFIDEGMASFYADRFHGRLTASGEPFNMYAMTAAHKTLPFGTEVKVTDFESGKSIFVTINDRGPYAHNRIIDLSKKAALELGIYDRGIAKVKIEQIASRPIAER